MRILLAVDGSPHSQDAVEEVRRRPWPSGSSVRILAAVPPMLPPPPAPAWSGVVVGYQEIQERRRAEAEALVSRVAASLRERGLRCETAVVLGEARGAILDEADRWSADLIVMGSRGLSGLKRWLIGSVAQYVVTHAPCSVEVVRSRAPASPSRKDARD